MTRRWIGDIATIVVVVALLGATYLLPPDTSLRLVRERGVLRVCVPDAYPPLVTGDADRPGIDVEIVEHIAERLGLRIQLVQNSAMGRDFNPRNWRVTRAQCQMLAGGIVATDVTRSFLETTPPHLETGWASVVPDLDTAPPLDSARVGFVPGSTGLDRIELSSYLRGLGATVRLYPGKAGAVNAIQTGDVDVLVTEALQARSIAEANDWAASYLPDRLARYPIAFGLWKGDLTLKRAVLDVIAEMRAEGLLEDIRREYGLGRILPECPYC